MPLIINSFGTPRPAPPMPTPGAVRKAPFWLGLAVLGYALFEAQDRFSKGAAHKRDIALSEFQTRAAMEDWRHDVGRWSGFPMMDKIANWVHRNVLYGGPLNLGPMWVRFKANVDTLVNDGIMPVLPFIGIGTIGLYAGLGKERIHGAVGGFFRGMGRYLPNNLGSKLGSACLKPLKWTVDLAARGFGAAVKHPWFALGGLALGALTLNNFKDSYEQEGTDTFFRSYVRDINNP